MMGKRNEHGDLATQKKAWTTEVQCGRLAFMVMASAWFRILMSPGQSLP
jgi:hypothetical protein